MTKQCCGLAVIFCGFISHLIGRETINIPEIFSGVHGFTGKSVKLSVERNYTLCNTLCSILISFVSQTKVSISAKIFLLSI